MNNKYQLSDPANTSAVQFWVYCAYSEVQLFEFLSRFVNAKLANRDFQISVVDILYPCRMVQIIRVDDSCQHDIDFYSSVLLLKE